MQGKVIHSEMVKTNITTYVVAIRKLGRRRHIVSLYPAFVPSATQLTNTLFKIVMSYG